MKKTDLQRYVDFKKRHGLAYEDIVKIVSEYANSDYEFARSFFSEKYGISENTFYKCRDLAVICHLVNRDICEKLREKTGANYAVYSDKNSASGSYKHFADLIRRRNVFLTLFTTEEITQICRKYSEGIKFDIISLEYEVCVESIKQLLKKAIVDVIVPASLVDEMKERAKKEGKNISAFKNFEEQRDKKKIAMLEPYQREIELLHYQIDNYEGYFLNDEYAPEKEYLTNRLAEVEKKYQRILDF